MSFEKALRKLIQEEVEAAVANALNGNTPEPAEEEEEEEEEAPKPAKKKAAKKKTTKKKAAKKKPEPEEEEDGFDDEFEDDGDDEGPQTVEEMKAPIVKAVNDAEDREEAMKAVINFLSKEYDTKSFKAIKKKDYAAVQKGALSVIASL